MPQVSSQLRFADHLGRWKVRWGIGRNSCMVPPGLYAIGSPGPEAPVVVTANYKVTYDLVRSSLGGRDIWLLVLETFGINVWCAAGKGSFGTGELVRRVRQTGLEKVLGHRTLLLPILGAPGVAAHEVAKETGFEVRYAALRVADLPEYLDNGMNTTPAMRELTFTLAERLALVPVEWVLSFKFALPATALLLTVGWWLNGFSAGLTGSIAFLGAIAAGTVAVTVLLPWLPGASFACKGMIAGLLWSGCWVLWAGENLSLPTLIGSVLALTTVSSFYALNFTGSTPFTSPSGVRKEMRTAFPAMASALIIAVVLWIGV
ncbi:MAG: acetyl-CoA synthase subunit gamma [Deltaproteobacteria bacterium]|nr:acetyl-CoA synthase subunit gamma [Deltaproteobacteria bacterium]